MRGVLQVLVLLLLLVPTLSSQESVTIHERIYATSTQAQSVSVPANTTTTVAFPNNFPFKNMQTTINKHSTSPVTLTYYQLEGEPISKYALARFVHKYVAVELDEATEENLVDSTSTITFTANVDVNPQDIALYYYDTQWVKANTRYLGQNTTKHFQATVPTFGYYAIVIEQEEELILPIIDVEEPQNQTEDNETKQPEMQQPAQVIEQREPEPIAKPIDYSFIGTIVIVIAGSGLGVLVIIFGMLKYQQMRHRPKTKHEEVSDVPKEKKDVNELLQKYSQKYQVKQDVPTNEDTDDDEQVKELEQKIATMEPKIVENYVQWATQIGMTREQIKQNLQGYGLDSSTIEEVLSKNI